MKNEASSFATSDTSSLSEWGLALRSAMAVEADTLDAIETELRRRALEASAAGEVVPLSDPKLEGTQWLATGEWDGDTVTVPVVITSDQLVRQFAEGSRMHAQLLAIARDKLPEFFALKKTYVAVPKTGKEYRKCAVAFLDKEKGAELIAATRALDKNGLPKNEVRVCWDRVNSNTDTEASEPVSDLRGIADQIF